MNTPQQARQLIELYCEHYGIKPEELKRRKSQQPARVMYRKDNYINTAAMRMALGYFIFMHFPMRIIEIAKLVGYTDHSPLSSQRRTIEHYIENKDPYFYHYYEQIVTLAPLVGITMEYKRVHSLRMPFVRHESNTEFAEQIKYYENA